MHRSYQSILPAQNKFLQKRWDTTYYNEHKRKVRDAASVVDTRPPATFVHLHLKLKKLQLEEERLATIERDNRILLEKMSYIMRTQGRVDNRNNYEFKSLNLDKRQREMERVTRENQMILCRINARKPEYSHLKWQKDWERNQKFMDSISAYPADWWVKEKKSSRRRKGSKTPAGKEQKRKGEKEQTVEKEATETEEEQQQREKGDSQETEVKDTRQTKAKEAKKPEIKETKQGENKRQKERKEKGGLQKEDKKKIEEGKVKEKQRGRKLEVPVEEDSDVQ